MTRLINSLVIVLFVALPLQTSSVNKRACTADCDDETTQIVTDSRCNTCQKAMGYLVSLVGQTWNSETQKNWTAACLQLLKNINNTGGPIMCPGLVAIQGPHLHRTLVNKNTGVSPYKFCEMLNYCIPPDPGVKSHDILKPTLPISVLQLTDLHIDDKYVEGSPSQCDAVICCQATYNGTNPAGKWGAPKCNIPDKTMDLLVQRITEMKPKPDYIIYSGDSPSQHMWDETLASQLSGSQRVAKVFIKKLQSKGFKVFFAIGNHEMYPTNLYSSNLTETKILTKEFYELWHNLAGLGTKQKVTFIKGGYYSIKLERGLRLLVVNTNYWYTSNYYNALGDCRAEVQEMHQFIIRTLKQARCSEEKVILVCHHPPGDKDSIIKSARWFRDVALEYYDVITLHMSGHTHLNEFRLVRDPVTGIPYHTVFVAPSGNTHLNINPSVRVYQLDRTTFQHLDYDQYYLDIYSAKAYNTLPLLVHSYSARKEYSLTDMSPQSYFELTKRLETDPELFKKFWLNQYSRAIPFDCDDTCKKSRICNLRCSVYDNFLQCTNLTEVADIFSTIADALFSFY